MKKTLILLGILPFLIPFNFAYALIDGAYYDTQVMPYNAICANENNYFWVYDQNNLETPLVFHICSFADGLTTFIDAGINAGNYNVIETSDTDPTLSVCYLSPYDVCLASINFVNNSAIQIISETPPPPPATTTATTTGQLFIGGFTYGEVLEVLILLMIFTLLFFSELRKWIFGYRIDGTSKIKTDKDL